MRARYCDSAITSPTTVLERVPNAIVTVYIAGTDDDPILDTIWKNATGTADPADIYSNPFETDATGRIEFFLDAPRSVKIKVENPVGGSVEYDYQPVMPAPEDIVLRSTSAATVIYLSDYYDDPDVPLGLTSAQTYIDAAIADASAAGAVILVPPGTFLGYWRPTDGVRVVGAGLATTLKRPDNTYVTIWDGTGVENTELALVHVDGNYPNCHTPANFGEAATAEVVLSGQDNKATDVTVTNYNWSAYRCSGVRPKWIRCKAVGISGTSFDADRAPDPLLPGEAALPDVSTFNYSSYFGFNSVANDICQDPLWDNCFAEGQRVGGFYIGGSNGTMIAPRMRNTHRGESLIAVAHTYGVAGLNGVGGGQLAFTPTWSGSGSFGDVPCNFMTVVDPQVGFSGGIKVSGLEIDSVVDITISNIQVTNHVGFGISINNVERCKIDGGNIYRCEAPNFRVNDSKNITWTGIHHHGFVYAEKLEGTTDYWRASNCVYQPLTPGAVFRDTAFDSGFGLIMHDGPHHFDERLATATNKHATTFTSSDSTLPALHLRSNHSSAAETLALETLNVSGGIRNMIDFIENGAAKFHIGMSSIDSFALTNAAGTGVPFEIIPENGQTLIRSLASGTPAYISLGRTGHEAYLRVAAASNDLFVGVLAGDMVLASNSGSSAYFGASGNNSAIIGVNGAPVFQAVPGAEGPNKVLHSGSGNKATTDTTGYVWIPWTTGKPTGNPGAPTYTLGSVPIAIELSGGGVTFWIWSGAAWRGVALTLS